MHGGGRGESGDGGVCVRAYLPCFGSKWIQSSMKWVCSCVHVLCIAHRNTSYTLVVRSRIVSILIDFFPSLGFIMHLHKYIYIDTEVSDFSTSSCMRIGGKKSLHLITINWSLMAIKNSHSWCGAYSCRVCENAMQKINVSRGFFFQSFAMWMYTNELCVQFPIPCPCPCPCVCVCSIIKNRHGCPFYSTGLE